MQRAGDPAFAFVALIARLPAIACLVLLAQCAPKPAGALHPEWDAERAALLVSIERGLGEVAPAGEQGAYNHEAALLRAGGPAASADLASRTNAAASRFLDYVEHQVRQSRAWPADRPAPSYQLAALVRLSQLRGDLAAHAASGAVPEAQMRQADQLLALASGVAETPNGYNDFDDVAGLMENGDPTESPGPQPTRPAR